MAKRKLEVSIECGDKTCASEPGKFCDYFGTVKLGQIPVCMLFPAPHRQGSHTSLKEKDGWVLRCDACLEAELSDG